MTSAHGRKAFFLYPDDVIRAAVIDTLTKREFEAYGFSSYQVLGKILGFYENSILFLCADEGPGPDGWADLIREIHPYNETLKSLNDAVIYAIVKNDTKSPQYRKLASVIGEAFLIPYSESAEALGERIGTILEALSARGQRQYVRFGSADQVVAQVCLTCRGECVSGEVHDISSVGMSCSFPDGIDFSPKEQIETIEIICDGTSYQVKGSILLKRENASGKPVFVIMFDRKSSPEAQDQIRRFITASLKAQVERKLA